MKKHEGVDYFLVASFLEGLIHEMEDCLSKGETTEACIKIREAGTVANDSYYRCEFGESRKQSKGIKPVVIDTIRKPHYATGGNGWWWMMTHGVLFQGPTIQICWDKYMTWCWDAAHRMNQLKMYQRQYEVEQLT